MLNYQFFPMYYEKIFFIYLHPVNSYLLVIGWLFIWISVMTENTAIKIDAQTNTSVYHMQVSCTVWVFLKRCISHMHCSSLSLPSTGDDSQR